MVNYVNFWLFYFHDLFLLKKDNLTNALYIKYSCVFVKKHTAHLNLFVVLCLMWALWVRVAEEEGWCQG